MAHIRRSMHVTLSYPDHVDPDEVRKALLEAEQRANEGMLIRLHFNEPEELGRDDGNERA